MVADIADCLSAATRSAIIAAHGRESASTISKRLGVKRNTVLGTWAKARQAAERKALKKQMERVPDSVPASVHPDRVVGLHGVSLPRLRCLDRGGI